MYYRTCGVLIQEVEPMAQYKEASFPVIILSAQDKQLETVGDVLRGYGISFKVDKWPDIMIWTVNGNQLLSGEVTIITPIDENDLALCIFAVPDFIADLAAAEHCVRQSSIHQISSAIVAATPRSSSQAESSALPG